MGGTFPSLSFGQDMYHLGVNLARKNFLGSCKMYLKLMLQKFDGIMTEKGFDGILFEKEREIDLKYYYLLVG